MNLTGAAIPPQLRKTRQQLEKFHHDFQHQLENGHYANALRLGQRLTLLLPKDAHVHAHTAHCCLQLGRWTDAISYAQRALKTDPRHTQARHTLTQAYRALLQQPTNTHRPETPNASRP